MNPAANGPERGVEKCPAPKAVVGEILTLPRDTGRQSCPHQKRAGARLLSGKEGARLARGVYSYGTRPATAEILTLPRDTRRQSCPHQNKRAGARLLSGKEGARLARGVYSYGTRPATAESLTLHDGKPARIKTKGPEHVCCQARKAHGWQGECTFMVLDPRQPKA